MTTDTTANEAATTASDDERRKRESRNEVEKLRARRRREEVEISAAYDRWSMADVIVQMRVGSETVIAWCEAGLPHRRRDAGKCVYREFKPDDVIGFLERHAVRPSTRRKLEKLKVRRAAALEAAGGSKPRPRSDVDPKTRRPLVTGKKNGASKPGSKTAAVPPGFDEAARALGYVPASEAGAGLTEAALSEAIEWLDAFRETLATARDKMRSI